jgi:NitT/TauT family transport system ATP-binding protein
MEGMAQGGTAPTTVETPVALRFERAGKVFEDGTQALADVSLSVLPGEFVAIVGPSGCGKSTLLRIASGLTDATTGKVHVASTNLGYVFQDATLLPWRTVQGNVELFAELHGLPKPERRRLADEAIALVGLRGFEQHYPKALSGGMKMRASLARSLTLKPPVFLFDEPFGAIDEITRDHLNVELMRLFELERFAALFITHSISEAVFLSTRVHVMSARPGRIVASFDVPFGYPRPDGLRFEPEFAELTGALNQALREAHA